MKKSKSKTLISLLFAVIAASSCGNPTQQNTTQSTAITTVTEETTTEAVTTSAPAPSAVTEPAAPKLPAMVERMSETAVTNTIPDDVKVLAAKMPEANYKKLPDWNGTTLCNKYEYGWQAGGILPTYFSEELVKEVAGQGFNFVRVTLDSRYFYADPKKRAEPGQFFDGDSSMVSTIQLQNLDNLIKWCIENDIHVCLDLHNTPGGYMIGGDEEASRELLFTEGSTEEQMFMDFWEFISKRYDDISSNALSFDLYNEPPNFVTDEQYTTFIKKALDVIRQSSPDRLIFVDMLEYAVTPVYGLVGEKIVQTFHFYEPYEYTNSGFSTMDYESGDYNRRAKLREIITYPLPALNTGITVNDYIVSGSFPAGTKLTMKFSGGSVNVGVELLADGNEIFTQKFDSDLVADKGFKLDEYNNFSCYNELNEGVPMIEVTFDLPDEAKELRFVMTDKEKWLDMNELLIETETYKAKLVGQWIEEIGDNLPPTRAQVDENGCVTILNEAAEYNIGRQFIEDRFQKYKDFSDETGTLVMLQEFGDTVYTEISCAEKFYEDVLQTCDDLGINWVHYAYDSADFSYVAIDSLYKRHGATYEDLGDGRAVCVELHDVFRKHMG
ncbi:MAG: cellulase family glycosylhydrolase [Ruminiclostridium sp.]|nr:cellulase family glycosylhydrolase [Ruminiclostridium sp.]